MCNKKNFIVGYLGDSGLASLSKEDALKLTHINIAFGNIKNGQIVVNLKNLHFIKIIREYNPNIKILLSIGGWGAGGFSEAASTMEGRKLFAKTGLDIIKKYNLDGIDLDWEYPSYSIAGIASSKDDKINFTLLLKEIRELFDKEKNSNSNYLLTIATGADEYYIHGTEIGLAQKYLDYIQLMTYDMRGGFQTITGHHTNLFTSSGDLFRISVDKSVKIFSQEGVPKSKLVIGAAFYSRMWKNVPNIDTGLHQVTLSSGGYGPDYSTLVNDYININGFIRYWDDEAKAPYLFNGNTFITYDDEESIKHKCEYIIAQDLAGIMFWEFKCDNTKNLLNTMHSILK